VPKGVFAPFGAIKDIRHAYLKSVYLSHALTNSKDREQRFQFDLHGTSHRTLYYPSKLEVEE
jgi:hypothetical protein